MGEPRGRHLLAELSGCHAGLLNDAARLERALRDAAHAAQAKIVGHHFHAFSPQGVTGVLVLSESHLAIHTWPEHGYAAVDLFSCGAAPLDTAIALIATALKARHVATRELTRGPTSL